MIEDVNVACKFVVVAAGPPVVSIRNEPDGGGFFVVAVSSIVSVEPSGSEKLNLILSPSLGLTAPRSMVAAGGVPAGCVTVAPVSEDCTDSNFRPNGEPSSATLVTVVVNGGEDTLRRPMLAIPWSACRRSLISCVSPACVAVPSSITSAETVAAVSVARPENR